MLMTLLQVPLAAISGLIGIFAPAWLYPGELGYKTTCHEIATSVSSASNVYYEGTPFKQDFENWSQTNTEIPTCAFEPANTQDVGIALQILAKYKTPFAVRSGGHSPNPGFSSTHGVLIVLRSFSQVVYDQNAKTATIGMGLVWDDVFPALEQYNVTVIGGRSSGVGVGGFVLGGGYSYLSNQYGLSVDDIVSLELVMPNGTVAHITSSSNPDLFFGLRGGFNNFGIVTTVTMKTHHQSQVWGGSILYTWDQWEEVNKATASFVSKVTDPKASIYVTVEYIHLVHGMPVMMVTLFYDAPTHPDGMFDEFLKIKYFKKDITTRTFLNLLKSFPSTPPLIRIVTHWVPIEQFTLSMLRMIMNQTMVYGKKVSHAGAMFLSYDLTPFLPSLYDHSETLSAFPPLRGPGQGHSFIEVICGWEHEISDEAIGKLTAESAAYMKQFAVDAGQNVSNALLYPNAAPSGTPLVDMYGDALDRLRSIRAAVDPGDVMGRAGGWKF
ncbi:FAD-binding domain-containing protein [Suillus decipiens]|nr:FAD-binding domain-containing protein [Suillus decipiens]